MTRPQPATARVAASFRGLLPQDMLGEPRHFPAQFHTVHDSANLRSISRLRAAAIAAGSAALVWLSGCAAMPELVLPAAEETPEVIYMTRSVEHGKASYYYGRWIGRKTANGEIYRASDVTAAHRTLPFNTKVRVTNLRNGKQVIVRINNRGPFIRGRIIDLSLEAARRIDMTKAGVVPVKVEVLREIPVLRRPNLRYQPQAGA